MSDCKCKCERNDWSFVALVVWILMCWGSPDLLDALIHYLMSATA